MVSSTNKTDRHDITAILLKVALNTINQPNQSFNFVICYKTAEFILGALCSVRKVQLFEPLITVSLIMYSYSGGVLV